MPFIEIIHNETEYHLELYNEEAVKNAGLNYTLVGNNDKDLRLSSLEDILSIIGTK